MTLNYYTIASLPELSWDREAPMTLSQFLDDYQQLLEPLADRISEILLFNDIQNIELYLKSKQPGPDEFAGNYDGETVYYDAKILETDKIGEFLDNPFIYQPDEYPEFMVEYLEQYKDAEERYKNIEKLYIRYFNFLKGDESGFFRFHARLATTVRTVLAALRIMRSGASLEENLKGDSYLVKVILDHRTTSDLGLKNIFYEVPEIIALFEKEPVELERDLDRIRFKLFEEVGQETPFGDHIIYSYIIRLMVKDKWNTLSKERGTEVLNRIIEG